MHILLLGGLNFILLSFILKDASCYNFKTLEEAGSCDSESVEFFENKCCHPLISKTDILNTNDIIIDSSISGYNHNLSKLFDGNVNSEDPNAVVVCGAQEISDTNDLSFLSDGQKSVNVNATTSVLACVAENAGWKNFQLRIRRKISHVD